MADEDTTRLCEQIIRTHFGPLTAVSRLRDQASAHLLMPEQKVASVLLCRGRMPLAYIIRFSGLKPRTVRAAILVLVQHNVLWHAQSDDEGEVLEINIDECLTRLRFGRYVWQAEQLFGKAVRQTCHERFTRSSRPPDRQRKLSSSSWTMESCVRQTSSRALLYTTRSKVGSV